MGGYRELGICSLGQGLRTGKKREGWEAKKWGGREGERSPKERGREERSKRKEGDGGRWRRGKQNKKERGE